MVEKPLHYLFCGIGHMGAMLEHRQGRAGPALRIAVVGTIRILRDEQPSPACLGWQCSRSRSAGANSADDMAEQACFQSIRRMSDAGFG
jgi:hypothetical protein